MYLTFLFVLKFALDQHHGAANGERKLTMTLFIATAFSLFLSLPYAISSDLSFAIDISSSLSEIAFYRLNRSKISSLFASSLKSDTLCYENARF